MKRAASSTTRRTRIRAARPITLYCLFCATALTRWTDLQWHCPRCGAAWTLRRNACECVIALSVEECGAGDDCCQSRRGHAPR